MEAGIRRDINDKQSAVSETAPLRQPNNSLLHPSPQTQGQCLVTRTQTPKPPNPQIGSPAAQHAIVGRHYSGGVYGSRAASASPLQAVAASPAPRRRKDNAASAVFSSTAR